MSDSDKRDTREPRVDIGLNLGGLFKNLGDLVDSISAAVEQAGQAAEGAVERSGELKLDRDGKLRGVYGFSIRSGIGGAPRVERFGNLRPTERGPEVAPAREPLVDVFDEGPELLVVAELPGVDQAEIAIELNADVLAIETSGERRYAKEVLLPTPGDPQGLSWRYHNGILEIRVPRAP